MRDFKNRIKNNGKVCNMEVITFFSPALVGPLRKDNFTEQRVP